MIYLSFSKKLTITIWGLVVLLLMGGFLGLINGFPWEHTASKETAKKYVIEKYGITPTKLTSGLSLDMGMYVTVYTKEHDFSFYVVVSRKDSNKVLFDKYYEEYAENNLIKSVKDEVQKLVGEKNTFGVIFDVGIPSNTSEQPLTFDEINSDVLFEELKGDYRCGIMYNNVSINNLNVDYGINYQVFKLILLSKLSPEEIVFLYRTDKGEYIAQISIENSEYDKINSPNDMKSYFKNVD